LICFYCAILNIANEFAPTSGKSIRILNVGANSFAIDSYKGLILEKEARKILALHLRPFGAWVFSERMI